MQHDIITTKVGMGMQNINDLFEALYSRRVLY